MKCIKLTNQCVMCVTVTVSLTLNNQYPSLSKRCVQCSQLCARPRLDYSTLHTGTDDSMQMQTQRINTHP